MALGHKTGLGLRSTVSLRLLEALVSHLLL
jgi:hypothetical protein